MGEPGLRCWCVSYYDQSTLVYASARGKARAAGAAELDGELEFVHVARHPEWDERRPTTRELIMDHGWWWSCEECSHPVDEIDMCDGGGFDEQGNPWCHECWQERDAILAHKREVARVEAVTVYDVAQSARQLWGDKIELVDVHVYGQTMVSFRFPGGRWPMSWHPGAGTAYVARVDLDAYAAWRPGELSRWEDDGGQVHHG